MRLNDLERMLANVPPHPAPDVVLEQYATPADLAAPLLFEARALGDVEGKRVVDLGCGTGIFAIGASLLGASEVTGVDVDPKALAVARGIAVRLGAHAEWVASDVRAWKGGADTVIMNPPFGVQRPQEDRAFLDAAMDTAPVVYTLHSAPARAFVERHAATRGFGVTHAWRLVFPLRQQYRHHERAVQEIEVVALRLTQSRESA